MFIIIEFFINNSNMLWMIVKNDRFWYLFPHFNYRIVSQFFNGRTNNHSNHVEVSNYYTSVLFSHFPKNLIVSSAWPSNRYLTSKNQK